MQVYLAEWHHTPVAVKVLSLDSHNALDDRRMVEKLFHEGARSSSHMNQLRLSAYFVGAQFVKNLSASLKLFGHAACDSQLGLLTAEVSLLRELRHCNVVNYMAACFEKVRLLKLALSVKLEGAAVQTSRPSKGGFSF